MKFLHHIFLHFDDWHINFGQIDMAFYTAIMELNYIALQELLTFCYEHDKSTFAKHASQCLKMVLTSPRGNYFEQMFHFALDHVLKFVTINQLDHTLITEAMLSSYTNVVQFLIPLFTMVPEEVYFVANRYENKQISQLMEHLIATQPQRIDHTRTHFI